MNQNQFEAELAQIHQDAGDLSRNDSRYRNVQIALAKAMAYLNPNKAMQLRGNAIGHTTTTVDQAPAGPSRFKTSPPPKKAAVKRFVPKKGVPPVSEPKDEAGEDTGNEDSETTKHLEGAVNSGALTVNADGTLLEQFATMSVDEFKSTYSRDELFGLAAMLGLETETTWNKAQVAGAIRQHANENTGAE